MGFEIVMPEMGILFEDKHCTVRLLNIDNQCDSYEWWWEEPEFRTVFVVSWCPANYPGLVVHRLTASQAAEELEKLLTEGWTVTRRGQPEFLKVPEVEKTEYE